MPKSTRQRRRTRKRRLSAGLERCLAGEPWAIDQAAYDQLAGSLEHLGEGGDLDLIGAATAASTGGLVAQEEETVQLVGRTAVLPVRGVIRPESDVLVRFFGGTSLDQLRRQTSDALGNDQVEQLVLLINSPGGSAIGLEETFRALRAAGQRKPLVAVVKGMAASAAYYLAAAAERIVAGPSSLAGSIGTLVVHSEARDLFEDIGITNTVVRFGANKALANQVEKLSDRGRQQLQELVDAYGSQFVQAVAEGRNRRPDQVMQQMGQGQLFIAAEALSRGLIDEIGELETVLDARPAQPQQRTAAAQPSRVAGVAIGPEASTEPTTPEATVAAGTSSAAARPEQEKARMKITARLRAALFARGYTDSEQASDQECRACLRTLAMSRQQTIDDETSEQQLLDLVIAAPQQQATSPTAGNTVASEAAGSGEGQANQSHDQRLQLAAQRERDEAATAAREEERQRIASIRQSAELLNISDEQVAQAIDSGEPHSSVVAAWHQQLATSGSERPVGQVERIQGGEAAIEKFVAAASDAMAMRCGSAIDQPAAGAADLENAHLAHIAGEYLRIRGERVGHYETPERLAMRFLQLDSGAGVIDFSAAASGYHRPGDFPNLLSVLAGKILDQGVQMSEATYPMWTGRLPDVSDFKPHTIVGVGGFDELDIVVDDDDPGTLALDDELSGWIQADRFANIVKLTPVMVANDDLDGFGQALRSLGMAHETTLNRLCLSIVGNNEDLPDGTALFHANHGNLVSSGGAPSITQLDNNRKLHRQQTGIGGTGKVRTPPAILLAPSALETDAEQLLLPASGFSPTQDSNINVFRNRIRPVIDADLDDYSALEWYTFANPMIRRTIVHVFMRGYGRGGRRTRWFDNASESVMVKLEGRFAAAAAGHRGAVKNPGT